MKKPDWLTPALVVAIVCSSMAAAVFTWWMNRPTLTELIYNITTTSTVTDARTQAVIPNLEIRIGGEVIQELYTHVVELRASGGYADKAMVAITLPNSTRIFGTQAKAPSSLFGIDCPKPTPNNHVFHCSLGPLDPKQSSPFSFTAVTNNRVIPLLEVTGRNMDLKSVQQAVATGVMSRFSDDPLSAIISFASVIFTLMAVIGVMLPVLFSNLRSAWRDVFSRK